jgi:hypothetical protein
MLLLGFGPVGRHKIRICIFPARSTMAAMICRSLQGLAAILPALPGIHCLGILDPFQKGEISRMVSSQSSMNAMKG